MNASVEFLDTLKAVSRIRFEALTQTVHRGGAEIALAETTVDDIALAARELEDHLRTIGSQVQALQDLHDLARRRGALGADLIADLFKSGEVSE